MLTYDLEDIYNEKKIKRLSLTNFDDEMNYLLSKWIIKACKPSHFNLLIFFRYRLATCQPTKKEK